jgi:hypothetical protein
LLEEGLLEYYGEIAPREEAVEASFATIKKIFPALT